MSLNSCRPPSPTHIPGHRETLQAAQIPQQGPGWLHSLVTRGLPSLKTQIACKCDWTPSRKLSGAWLPSVVQPAPFAAFLRSLYTQQWCGDPARQDFCSGWVKVSYSSISQAVDLVRGRPYCPAYPVLESPFPLTYTLRVEGKGEEDAAGAGWMASPKVQGGSCFWWVLKAPSQGSGFTWPSGSAYLDRGLRGPPFNNFTYPQTWGHPSPYWCCWLFWYSVASWHQSLLHSLHIVGAFWLSIILTSFNEDYFMCNSVCFHVYTL